jgi:hypothetical protein
VPCLCVLRCGKESRDGGCQRAGGTKQIVRKISREQRAKSKGDEQRADSSNTVLQHLRTVEAEEAVSGVGLVRVHFRCLEFEPEVYVYAYVFPCFEFEPGVQ